GFPLWKKLQVFRNTRVSSGILIINGVECDPGLVHDKWLMEHDMSVITRGAVLIAGQMGIKRTILVCGLGVRPDLAGTGSMEIVFAGVRYPAGEEQMIVRSVTGQELAPAQYPAEAGVLVCNVQTLHAVGSLYAGTLKKNSRIITIADLTSGRAQAVRVPLGIMIEDVSRRFSAVNGTAPAATRIIQGGGLFHAGIATPEDRVDSTTNLVARVAPWSFDPESPCRGCGACRRSCPQRLPLPRIVKGFQKNTSHGVSRQVLDRCIGCGSCSYHCKASIPVQRLVAETAASSVTCDSPRIGMPTGLKVDCAALQ
ncbi:MAG: 4Fe-4S dicluster domain-containing protein, partial [Spirochaeta sp.]